MNCNDAWSTHALAHVYEMKGWQDEGIGFMSKTLNDWQVNVLSLTMSIRGNLFSSRGWDKSEFKRQSLVNRRQPTSILLAVDQTFLQ